MQLFSPSCGTQHRADDGGNHKRNAKRQGGRPVVPKSLGHDGARDAAGAILHSAELDETTTSAPASSLFAVKPPGPATTLGRSIPPLHPHDSIEHAADRDLNNLSDALPDHSGTSA